MRIVVPNTITAVALMCAVVSILLSLRGEVHEATWWVLYSTLLDRMDGAAARALKASTAVGAQMDSFADFASFGLAPAFLFLGIAAPDLSPGLLLPVAVYVIGCAVRLARFNMIGSTDLFQGVPTTVAGGIYAVVVNVCYHHGVLPEGHLWPFALLLAGFGVAMNLPWLRYRKLGRASRGLNVFMGIVVLLCAVLILSRRLPEILLLLTGLTLVLGPILSARAPRPPPARPHEP
ncbi:MAG: CDP-alcohol phosphatidyltransferase family protein [Myxococcota bacterium]|nr:CDP-alcohol phosphatidyltransferase family protein [Myxococcota bacterium]